MTVTILLRISWFAVRMSLVMACISMSQSWLFFSEQSTNGSDVSLQSPFVIVAQSLSCVPLFVTPWAAELQVSLSFTVSGSLLKPMSIESVMQSNHLILCHPLLLPSVFPRIRVFPNESALHIRWPKYWSFSISPSSEYSGLISFRIDWFDLLAVPGTLKSFPAPQFESINSSLLNLLYGQILIMTFWQPFLSPHPCIFTFFSPLRSIFPSHSNYLLFPELTSMFSEVLTPVAVLF